MNRRATSRIGTHVLIAVTLLLTLAGCSLPDVSMSRSVKPKDTKSTPASSSSAATKAAAVKTTTVKAAPVRPAGVLDTGSVTHRVTVGAFTAVLVYYTSDDAKAYRPSSTKTIRLAVHIEGAGAAKNTILVNNFVATADDGVVRATVKHDPRSFSVSPPQSYNAVVVIPAAADSSPAVTLIVELDLSIQVKPGSRLYGEQTALDQITLPQITGSRT